MSDWEIAEGRNPDVERLVVLLGQLGYQASRQEIAERIERMSGSRSDKVFVAVCAGDVVGCASVHAFDLFHRNGRLGRITSLVVDERHRGQGIGRALVDASEQFLSGVGCGRIEVTSNVRRVEAHAFYERCGFVATSKRFEKNLK